MKKKIGIVLLLAMIISMFTTLCFADVAVPTATNSLESAVSILLGIGLISMLIAIAILVFCIVCLWRILTKAGEPGWKCLIPFYNIYTECKISGINTVVTVVYLVALILPNLVKIAALSTICGLVAFVLSIYACYMLSKAFGHGVGFTIGLIFLSPIFYGILAFGSSTYVLGKGQTSQATDATSVDDIL